MCILIFSESFDNTTNYVVEYFNNWNIPYVRINTNLEENNISSVSITNGGTEFQFVVKNKTFKIEDFKIVWARRGFFRVKINKIQDDNLNKEVVTAINNHISTEYRTLLDYLEYYISSCEVTTIGMISHKHINKLIVLQKAKLCGFKIPDSIILKDETYLNEIKDKNTSLISKPISERFMNYIVTSDSETNKLIEQDYIYTTFKELKDKKFSYSLFQSKIDIKYELRVFFIFKHYYAAVNLKVNNKRVMIPYKLPKREINKLNKLMTSLSLNTGSIDILVDKNNNYYFLEVNPFGQIEWLVEECFPNLHFEIAIHIKQEYEKQKNINKRFN